MDSRERFDDYEEAIRATLDGFRGTLWTALPGSIVDFDAVKLTASVQPGIQGIVRQPDGSFASKDLPVLPDVPLVFPRGGNCTLTFPVAKGDECLVVFSSRCIDSWWQSGGSQIPFEPRMHDLSDGFAILGPFSQQQKISGFSAATTQLRSNDGQTYIELDASNQIVHVEAPGGLTIKAPTVAITGAVTVSGTLAAQQNITSQADVLAAAISLKNHKHGGVQSGGSLTTPPQ